MRQSVSWGDGVYKSTGTTLVQSISQPAKPIALLTSLHNLMEHSEGPPDQPWQQVYAKVVTQVDTILEAFRQALEEAKAPFGN